MTAKRPPVPLALSPGTGSAACAEAPPPFHAKEPRDTPVSLDARRSTVVLQLVRR